MEIKNFEELKKSVTELYHLLKECHEGEVANYIPQLAKVNPDLFGISICTVAGERFDIGDCDTDFCLQSCSKPLTYCIAREILGDEVHKYVGYEPSGQAFNAFVLDKNNHPHNPMINAGAIMTCSLIEPELEPALRFEFVLDYIKRMTGNRCRIGFDTSVFLSEKKHADRNYALAYFMNEKHAFPERTNIMETLDLYFQACSITMNSIGGSIISATMANSGTCPINKEKVFNTETVRDCLSLMYQCGMYDYSGQFAFKVGLPAKSGVSGCLFLVIPNEMGICIWSPRLDSMGNTVRGVRFCNEIIKKHKFHIFHNIVHKGKSNNDEYCEDMYHELLIKAAAKNDFEGVQKYCKKADPNVGDYDGRTAIHLAAAEGHLEIVKFLLELNVDPRPLDRWGNTPYFEAKKKLTELKVDTPEWKSVKEICELLKTFDEQNSSNNGE